MKFQMEELIDSSDEALVMGALARSVGPVSLRTVYTGGELRVYGIGPSPRPVHAGNVSVFRVEPAGDGWTRVRVEAEFLASALLEAASQEPAVRDKIGRVMRLAKEEVSLHVTAERDVAEMAESADAVESQASGMDRRSAGVPEAAAGGFGLPVAAETRSEGRAAADLGLRGSTDPASWTGVAREDARVDGVAPAARHVSSGALPREEMGRVPARQAPGTAWRSEAVWSRLAMAAAVLLLITAAYLFGVLRERSRRPAHATAAPARLAASRDQPSEVAAGSPAPETPVATAGDAPTKPSAAVQRDVRPRSPAARGSAAPPATKAAEPPNVRSPLPSAGVAPSLEERLEEWAASMQSTDAAVQASFYADHLDRYFLKTDVDHDFVVRDKQDFLRKGHRVKQFQVENVEVEDETDSSAKLRLLKHYVVQAGPDASAVERRVRSELNLRRIGGRWEITGERDFR